MTSIQDKLAKVRKPRVHIHYEVETETGVEQNELPFVMGVMGDFSGDNQSRQLPLPERQFVEIHRDNFDKVMQSIAPALKFRVDNQLDDAETQIAVDLKFNCIEDFEPLQIVKQVPCLNTLLELRCQLRELLNKTDCSYELEQLLEGALKDKSKIQQLAQQLGLEHQDLAVTGACDD